MTLGAVPSVARALLRCVAIMGYRTKLTPEDAGIRFDPLRRRCIRLAKSGQYRKAALALAELAHREQDAATWVRLGTMLLRAGKIASGIDALKQGLWLHRIGRKPKRAEVVQRLISQVTMAHAA